MTQRESSWLVHRQGWSLYTACRQASQARHFSLNPPLLNLSYCSELWCGYRNQHKVQAGSRANSSSRFHREDLTEDSCLSSLILSPKRFSLSHHVGAKEIFYLITLKNRFPVAVCGCVVLASTGRANTPMYLGSSLSPRKTKEM